MIFRHTYHDLVWIDVERPTHEEIRMLMNEFDISPLIADELLTPSLRPKVEQYENMLYLILHFPALRSGHNNTLQEVDFIVGKKFIITVRYDLLDPLHKFSKVFEVNSVLDRSDIGDHAGYILFYMMRKLYTSLGHDLAMVSERLRDLEARIYKGEERKMVERLSAVHRDLLTFHRALRFHKPILQSLGKVGEGFFGRDFGHHTDSIQGEYYKVEELLSDQKESLDDLRSTNDSLLTTKTNEIMKALTATNFLLLPAALIIQIFTLPAEHVPIIGKMNDFWIVMGITVIVVGSTFTFFKLKKWL